MQTDEIVSEQERLYLFNPWPEDEYFCGLEFKMSFIFQQITEWEDMEEESLQNTRPSSSLANN